MDGDIFSNQFFRVEIIRWYVRRRITFWFRQDFYYLFIYLLLGDTYVDVSPFDFVKIFLYYLFIFFFFKFLFFLEFVRKISQEWIKPLSRNLPWW